MINDYRLQRKINCGDKELILGERTVIMGILNVTPDSFSDGGNFSDKAAGIAHAKRMIDEGADIIDVGGESTRPGSMRVLEEEEIARVIPIIKALATHHNTLISIDSYKSRIVEKALESGAHIINDVWGFQKDRDMAKVAAQFQVPSILMHNQEGTDYSIDIIDAMKRFFDDSIEWALKSGLKQELIILDPGIGFGKTPQQNIHVMKRLDEIKAFGFPVLLGTSRKSMIGKILDLPSDQRLEGTLATNVYGILSGVEIIRVHDVKEHLRAAQVMDSIIRGTL